MTETESLLFATLREKAINHDLHEHEPVFTVEDSARLHAAIPGAHTKNLFLKDGTGRYWLVTLPADARANLKSLAPLIGSKKLSFGSSEELLTLLGLTPGSVTPLGAINDSGRQVAIVLDKGLMRSDRVNVHPLRNTATLGLDPVDLRRLLTDWGHSPVVFSVPLLETDAAARKHADT